MYKILNTKFGKAQLNIKTGYFQIFDGENKGKYLHRVIFEDFYNFKIPNDFVVHHKDENKLNNCILNIQLLSRKEHAALHSKGRNFSKETKQKLRKMNLGENNPMYGKHISEEHKKRISESHKGKIVSKETKQKIIRANTHKHATIIKNGNCNGKQMYAIYMNGKTIKQSNYPYKLLDWFTKEFPREILQIKIKL